VTRMGEEKCTRGCGRRNMKEIHHLLELGIDARKIVKNLDEIEWRGRGLD